VLGNGKQRKSYLYVHDCIDAIMLAVEKAAGPINIFNLGREDFCLVNDSLNWICESLGVNPERLYTGGERGWIGDSPLILLDTSRIASLGWKPKLRIRDGVVRTVQYLRENPWVFDHRQG
jgi:UDP-glucose 4-epimerase